MSISFFLSLFRVMVLISDRLVVLTFIPITILIPGRSSYVLRKLSPTLILLL